MRPASAGLERSLLAGGRQVRRKGQL